MSTAKACSRDSSKPEPSQADLFADASTVFVAHLVRTDEVSASTLLSKEHPESIVEATFRTIEIFKGQPPADGKVRSLIYGPGNCSVPLLAGSDYLFFLDSNNFAWILSGSELFSNLDGTEPKKILSELRELAEKAQ